PEPARETPGADSAQQQARQMVELESEVERQHRVEQREGMQETGRDLSEQRETGLGHRVPPGDPAMRQRLCDVELDRVVEPAGVAVVELHAGSEHGRDEGEKDRETKEYRRVAPDACGPADCGHPTRKLPYLQWKSRFEPNA